MNLYIVSSPFQLLCAIESWLDSNEQSVFWIIRGKSAKADKFMLDIAKRHLKNEIIYYTQVDRPIIFLISRIKQFKRITDDYKIKTLYIGNIAEFSERLFAINVNCDNVWLLDDGAKTLVLKDFYTEKNKKIECLEGKNINSLIKFLIIKFFSLKTSKTITLNWFTIFDFIPKNGGMIRRHELLKFKKEINFNASIKNSADYKVYFIGSNLINAGVITNPEDYFRQLRNIKKYYEHKEVIYIPHRLEDSTALKRINHLGFEILELEQIIEIAFLERNIYPHTLASFYSTALYSLSKLFPKSRIDFFQLNHNTVSSKFRSSTTIVEMEYESVFGIIKN